MSRLDTRAGAGLDAGGRSTAGGHRIADALDAELRRVSVHVARLADEIEMQDPGAALERAALLGDAVERVRRVVRDLRWLGDLEETRTEPEHVDLEQVVTEVLARNQAKVQAADALVIREGLPAVRASRSDLLVLFEELLVNALQYRRDEPLVVRVSAGRDGNEWIVQVSDNGRGFDPQHGDQVFDALFVLVGDRVPSGSGVGLAAARLIVERNGGSIAATSHTGVGTTVTIRLPAAR